MKEIKFINSYSFIFSARPGTPAFDLSKLDPKKMRKKINSISNCCRKNKN